MAASTSTRLVRRRSKPRTASGTVLILGLIARLFSWYVLYNAVFQCPSEPSPDDPLICKGVASVREAVTPHVKPYYDQYAAEYVEKATPYIVYTKDNIAVPTFEKTKEAFNKHGMPQVEKLQRLAEPTVAWYSSEYKRIYSTYLEKHVGIAMEFAEEFHKGLYEFHERTVVPAYIYTAPHARKLFLVTTEYTVKHLIPQSKIYSSQALSFVYQFIWSPSVKFWNEYVAVQIGRISQRFTDGSVEEVQEEGINKLSSISAKISSSASSIMSSQPKAADVTSSLLSKAAATPKSSEPARNSKGYTKEEERAIIASDLKIWREKFENAADKATKDLNSQIEEIVAAASKGKRAEVETMFSDLDKFVSKEIAELKNTIVELAKHFQTGPDAESTKKARDSAFEQLYKATRDHGTAIRDRILAIRNEREQFAQKVLDEVNAAADSHIEVVDSVIDMGIQELGMKWAWKLDGVTYKDWKKYHELKKDFSDIRTPLTEAAEENESLIELSDWMANDWEDVANNKAKTIAEELTRLKAIGKRKIENMDWKETFGEEEQNPSKSKATKASDPAQKPLVRVGSEVKTPAAKVIVGGASAGEVKGKSGVTYDDIDDEAIVEKFQDVADSGMQYMHDASKAVSMALYGTKTQQDEVDKFTSIASEQYESAMSAASLALWGTATPTPEAVASLASAKFADAVSAASVAIYGTPDPTLSSMMSVASANVESAASVVSANLESAASVASVNVEAVASQAGEMAASVTNQVALNAEQVQSLIKELIYGKEPSFTESVMSRLSVAMYGTPTGKIESATSAAAMAFSSATQAIGAMVTPPPAVLAAVAAANNQFQDIINQASIAVYGKEKGSVEKAQEAVESAAADMSSKISVAVYGTQTAAYESATIALAQAAASASAALSEAIYGTQKGAVEQATTAVAEKWEAAQSVLAEQYKAAQEYASKAIYGEQAGYLETGYAQISEAMEAYRARLSEAVYGTPQGNVEKATRVAGEKLSEASSAAQKKIAEAQKAAKENAAAANKMAKEQAAAVKKAAEEAAVRAGVKEAPKGTVESVKSVVVEKVAEATEMVKEGVRVARDEL